MFPSVPARATISATPFIMAKYAKSYAAALPNRIFLLLETLAEHIAQLILNDFGAAKVRVRIVKPGILPDVAQVGIEIERTRE